MSERHRYDKNQERKNIIAMIVSKDLVTGLVCYCCPTRRAYLQTEKSINLLQGYKYQIFRIFFFIKYNIPLKITDILGSSFKALRQKRRYYEELLYCKLKAKIKLMMYLVTLHVAWLLIV